MKVFGTKLNMAASDEVDVVFNQTLTTKAAKPNRPRPNEKRKQKNEKEMVKFGNTS